MEYFSEEKKERWRKKRPDLPDPQVWCRDATAGGSPPPAMQKLTLARKEGWDAKLTYARGNLIDGDGKPVRHVTKIFLYDEGGNPDMTKPSAAHPDGQHRYQESETDEMVIIESVVLRAQKGDRWIRAVWERRIPLRGEDAKWKFLFAYTHQRKLASADISKVLRE